MRKSILTLVGVAAIISVGMLNTTLASAGTLDQSQPNAIVGFQPVGGPNGAAQTFTAGIGGPLDQVDILIAGMNCTPDLLVEIRPVDSGGTPTGAILALAAVSRASVPDIDNTALQAVWASQARPTPSRRIQPHDFAFRTYVLQASDTTTSQPTGLRAEALKKCKQRAGRHHWPRRRLKKCKKEAQLLPI